MVSLFHLLEQVVELIHLWKVSFVDWVRGTAFCYPRYVEGLANLCLQTIFLVVFLAVLILDVDYGIGIGVAYSIMTVMFRLQKPKVRGLGRMPGTDLYKPLEVYAGVRLSPFFSLHRISSIYLRSRQRFLVACLGRRPAAGIFQTVISLGLNVNARSDYYQKSNWHWTLLIGCLCKNFFQREDGGTGSELEKPGGNGLDNSMRAFSCTKSFDQSIHQHQTKKLTFY